jgi:agmatinase
MFLYKPQEFDVALSSTDVNFCDLPDKYSSLDESAIVILPVPYNETSTWIKGADKGPQAILEASANMEIYDIATDSRIYRCGIYTAPLVEVRETPEAMVEAVYNKTSDFLQQNKFVVTLGGDHSISIGTIQAHFAHYPNLTVLQLDAHADMRDEYLGSKFNHACVMARVKEMGPLVQVGIRSMSYEEKALVDPDRIYYAGQIVDNSTWIDRLLGQLSDNVYITIDLDVFDPSIMPSTGTPEPGGLDWYSILNMLEKVVQTKNLVGFDVVELCPNTFNKAPDFLAAKLIYQLLSLKFSQQQKVQRP